MSTVNIVLIIAGLFALITGIAAFFNPSFTRIINFPGGPKLKATAAIIAGLIIIIVGLVFQIPIS